MKKVIIAIIICTLYVFTVAAQDLPKSVAKLEKLAQRSPEKSIKYADKLVDKRQDLDVAFYYLSEAYYQQYLATDKSSKLIAAGRSFNKYKKQHSQLELLDQQFLSDFKLAYASFIESKNEAKRYISALKYAKEYGVLFDEEIVLKGELEKRLKKPPLPVLSLAKPASTTILKPKFNARNIISEADKLVGTKYLYGGESLSGLDCSGFNVYVYRKSGIDLPHSSTIQSTMGRLVDRETCEPGDLIFFGTNKSNGSLKIQHTGIVYSNNGGQLRIVHCPSRGVCIEGEGDPSFDMYWEKRFLFIKRLNENELLTTQTN